MIVEPVELTEFHDELRSVVRRLVGRPPSALGSLDPPDLDWPALADAGLLGLEAPDGVGGAGASFAEVAVVLGELGRSPASGPYLGSAVLATGALLMAEPAPGRDRLVAELAAGTTTAALVVDARTAGSGPSFVVRGESSKPEIAGRAELVPDVASADHLLVVAQGASGAVLVDVPATSPGLAVEDHPLVDATRRLGSVGADGVVCAPDAQWALAPDALESLADRAAIAVACDSLGLMEAMLETTVAYAKVRHQFGRPIGSFQAVQHGCADMLVATTVSRALVAGAVAAVAGDAPADARRAAVAMAKSHVGEAAVEVCGKAMQLHGGIGYTWESGIHAYLKRAILNRVLFGAPDEHRRYLSARYQGTAADRDH